MFPVEYRSRRLNLGFTQHQLASYTKTSIKKVRHQEQYGVTKKDEPKVRQQFHKAATTLDQLVSEILSHDDQIKRSGKIRTFKTDQQFWNKHPQYKHNTPVWMHQVAAAAAAEILEIETPKLQVRLIF